MRLLYSIVILLFSALPASAENYILKYEASWNGFTVGTIKVEVNESAKKYKYGAFIQSEGLLKTFTRYWSKNISSGSISSGKIIPKNYSTYWERKKEKHGIEISYKNAGKTVTEVSTPPEKRFKRPIVAPKDKNNTLDPVAASLYAKKQIAQIVASGKSFPQKIVIPSFDGRRRFDVELTVTGYQKKYYKGENEELLEIKFYRVPGAGWNEKELTRFKQQDPTITFYLNKEFIPVFGTGNAPFGTANFELVKQCQDGETGCN
jgi:hypothetical protein